MKSTPPIPMPEASQAPRTVGGVGTSSVSLVGLELTSAAIHWKSNRKSWTCLWSRSLLPVGSGCLKASWRVLKRPLAPGMASVMDLSSPRILCQVLVAIRRCVGLMLDKMSWSLVILCGGSSTVSWRVSRSQPRTTFLVAQVASPLRHFLMEAGSCRWGLSVGSKGRRTWSSEDKRARLTLVRRRGLPWTRPTKSST